MTLPVSDYSARDIDILAPAEGSVGDVVNQLPWTAFDRRVTAFVAALSRRLLTDPRMRTYPELISLGYWMRRSQVEMLRWRVADETSVRRGRGLAFHIAPANVDMIFIYSMILSLLAGNVNVVRVSSKEGEQVSVIASILREVLSDSDMSAVRDRLLILRFPHESRLMNALCAAADVRIIWGGDASVTAIRTHPLRPGAKDVTFPDRWSMAVFDARAFIDRADRAEVVRNFANDSYWFSQMACSSPRLMVWRGDLETVATAGRIFWAELETLGPNLTRWLQPMDYVNKRIFEDEVAVSTAQSHIRKGATNIVSVIELPGFDCGKLMETHCGAGLFLETRIGAIDELTTLMNPKLQTVVSFGVSAGDWSDFLTSCPSHGIDRVVPVGQALAFNTVWDGMDLLREFSRETSISV
jgi:hypothetical protein